MAAAIWVKHLLGRYNDLPDAGQICPNSRQAQRQRLGQQMTVEESVEIVEQVVPAAAAATS